jgi:hypothetical protein
MVSYLQLLAITLRGEEQSVSCRCDVTDAAVEKRTAKTRAGEFNDKEFKFASARMAEHRQKREPRCIPAKVEAVMAATFLFGWFCLPAPATEIRTLWAMGPQPLCMDPISLDKWYALSEAGRADMASGLPCVVFPNNTEVVIVGQIGDDLNVMLQAGGETMDVWVDGNHFGISKGQ